MRAMSGGIDLEKRYTMADLADLPEDGRRDELADGWLLVSPSARRLHQIGCKEIGRALEMTCPEDLYVFDLPINVDDPEATL